MVNCKTNKELWSSTEEMVGATTKAKIFWYKPEFQRTIKGSMKMEEYLTKMKSLADNLELAGNPLTITMIYVV